jgi:hypothetical protein
VSIDWSTPSSLLAVNRSGRAWYLFCSADGVAKSRDIRMWQHGWVGTWAAANNELTLDVGEVRLTTGEGAVRAVTGEPFYVFPIVLGPLSATADRAAGIIKLVTPDYLVHSKLSGDGTVEEFAILDGSSSGVWSGTWHASESLQLDVGDYRWVADLNPETGRYCGTETVLGDTYEMNGVAVDVPLDQMVESLQASKVSLVSDVARAHIFVSHSSPDLKYAIDLEEGLAARGAPCWIAPRDIPPGSDYGSEIVQAITTAKAFVLVYSESSGASRHCLREIELALKHAIPIYTVKIDNSPVTPGYEYRLATVQWVDGPIDQVVDRLGSILAAAS